MFQDRFKSEPIENDLYLLTVIRYIHQNPIKAGLCKNVSDYEFSSYREYFKCSDLIDSDFVFEIIEKEAFITFNNEKAYDICLDVSDKTTVKVTDEQAKEIIEKVSKCKNVAEFQTLSTSNRDKYLKKLREKGLSIRQISRLTGVSFNIVRKF